jgi:hypothetical protein
MKSSKEIRIAGLGLGWSLEHAIAYKDQLIYLGVIARILEGCEKESGGVLVAYCVRNFSKSEAIDLIAGLESNTSRDALPEGDSNADDST